MDRNSFIIAIISLPIILGQIMGPAKITIKSVEKCAEDAPGYKLDVNYKELNETQMGFDVKIDLAEDYDDKIQLYATVSKLIDDDWKPRVFEVRDPYACMFFMRNMGDPFRKILKDLGQPETCPVKKGVYEVKNFPFDGNAQIHMVYGQYKMDSMHMKGDQTLTCIRYLFDIEPRK